MLKLIETSPLRTEARQPNLGNNLYNQPLITKSDTEKFRRTNDRLMGSGKLKIDSPYVSKKDLMAGMVSAPSREGKRKDELFVNNMPLSGSANNEEENLKLFAGIHGPRITRVLDEDINPAPAHPKFKTEKEQLAELQDLMSLYYKAETNKLRESGVLLPQEGAIKYGMTAQEKAQRKAVADIMKEQEMMVKQREQMKKVGQELKTKREGQMKQAAEDTLQDIYSQVGQLLNRTEPQRQVEPEAEADGGGDVVRGVPMKKGEAKKQIEEGKPKQKDRKPTKQMSKADREALRNPITGQPNILESLRQKKGETMKPEKTKPHPDYTEPIKKKGKPAKSTKEAKKEAMRVGRLRGKARTPSQMMGQEI